MSQKPTTDIPDEWRAPLLRAALSHVPFDGWSDRILTLAARDLDLEPGVAKLAFPGGVADMIDLLARQRDDDMARIATPRALGEMSLRDKITLLVRTRIETESDMRETARRTLAYLSLPGHYGLALRILYRTVDRMWKCAADPSTDFNYYTKRLTLSAVYSSTYLYWLNDESENFTETWGFLDRRISDVMSFEKTKARIRKITGKLPDFWEKVSKTRYPSPSQP